VRLPGALTQTLGLPEGVLHLVPPELLAYTRSEAWKRGVPFQGGVATDLYGLGVLLYQALTDLHPFDPELPDKELLAAIADTPPTPPHLLNALAPHALSDIALRLLEKRPDARYPDTRALLQALERAAGGRFGRHAFVSAPAPAPDAYASHSRGSPPVHPTSQDSATSVRPSSLSGLLAIWICAATSQGCPAAQIGPERAQCPDDALRSMFQELKITAGSPLRVLVDLKQPEKFGVAGLYQAGPLVGRITVGEGRLVEGTLLYGELWTGPGLKDDLDREVVIGRYSWAVLPNGKKYPVCIALGGPDGRMFRDPGAQPGTVELPRDSPVNAVWHWP
jgi:eukaryotic-like serine/threonine-protein kinase